MRLRRLVNALQERVGSPAARDRVNFAVTRFVPKALPASPETAAALKALRREGYVFLRPLLSLQEIAELRRELEQRPCHDPWVPEAGEFLVRDTPVETNNARIKGVEQIPIARRVANDPTILQIVSSYLGCRPTIDDIVAWWSLPGRQIAKEEQFFHRDRDAVKFVKLFVYLSDVDESEGAHVFVPGSHNEEALLERRRRYADSDVFEIFPDRAKMMTGPQGTTFLEDTFGLHKGAVPATRSRLLLQVRYTSFPSNWAGVNVTKAHPDRSSPYDPYVNRLLD
jgi:hypothetical protein